MFTSKICFLLSLWFVKEKKKKIIMLRSKWKHEQKSLPCSASFTDGKIAYVFPS